VSSLQQRRQLAQLNCGAQCHAYPLWQMAEPTTWDAAPLIVESRN
jgi:hypothetical protein